MELLVDIFGFVSILLHGAATTLQSVALGGTCVLLALALPLRAELGAAFGQIERGARRITMACAFGLVLVALVNMLLKSLVVMGTASLGWLDLVGANFVNASLIKIAAALALGLLCRVPLEDSRRVTLVLAAVAVLVGSALTSHSVGRVDGRGFLYVSSLLHQAGAAIWIGGIPAFLVALHHARDGHLARIIGRRYSLISMAGVGILLAAGIAMTVPYTGGLEPEAMIGTAYGAMLTTKIFIFVCILCLGAANFFLVERLRRDPATPFIRLRRFAEVELGVGISIFFMAASLTSLPPAVDLTQDRATIAEVAERMTPRWPTLMSPDRNQLAISELQGKLDAVRAGAPVDERPRAYVPGSGVPVPRNAHDIAWSEYNHHWAGIIVLAIGLMALLEKTGRAPWARHWPLLFLLLAAFLFVRSEAEGWPFGQFTLAESLRDPEYVQHKLFMVLITGFSAFEWSVRTGRLTRPWAQYIFPLICAFGAMMLLTHAHAIDNVKELLLIEITHLPLAVFGMASGWARWLELRLPAPDNRLPGWIWPVCFCMVGLILIAYRES
ncbi:MAG: CopD family protein [Alphaproteobacteria bacterium]|nr:CopD family protein [Alphaproteobacteria bacterium]